MHKKKRLKAGGLAGGMATGGGRSPESGPTNNTGLQRDGDPPWITFVRAAMAGDLYALERLVSDFESRVYAICVMILRDNEDALDAVQDTWLIVCKNIRSLRDPLCFPGWLRMIAFRVALSHIGKMNRRSELSLSFAQDLVEPRGSPLDQLDRKESIEQVRHAMQGLTPLQRKVLLLRYLKDLPYKSVAAMLGKSAHQARANGVKALRSLRRILGDSISNR